MDKLVRTPAPADLKMAPIRLSIAFRGSASTTNIVKTSRCRIWANPLVVAGKAKGRGLAKGNLSKKLSTESGAGAFARMKAATMIRRSRR